MPLKWTGDVLPDHWAAKEIHIFHWKLSRDLKIRHHNL